jgi:NCS1 family nucleobase:cation symporter-1
LTFYSAANTTRDLISFFIYWTLFIPLVLYIPIYKLKTFMYPSIIMTAATLLGVLGWIVKENGGTTGPLVSSPVKVDSLTGSFLFLQCVSSTAAAWGGSGDRLSDWSRFAKKKWAPYPALFTGLPITLTLTATTGTFTTTAFYSKYGQVIWTPLDMLAFIQEIHYTPACLAGTFFAGIGLLTLLIYINIVQNTLLFGMDFAGVMPKYISMKRGSMIVVIVSIACNPWRFLTQSVVFVEVFSVFPC